MEWLTIIAIVGILLIIVWAVVGTFFFMNALFAYGVGEAFGWGRGPSMLSIAIECALWPILLPIGLLLDSVDRIRGR